MTNQAQGKPWDGHAEMPWKVRTDDFDCAILTHDGYTLIAETSDNEARDKANAALIVERVNKGPAADAMASVLESLARWFDADDEILDAMTADELADHNRQADKIRKALSNYRGEQP